MEAEVTTISGGKLEMPRVTLDPSGLEESNEAVEGDYQYYDDDYQEAENFIPDTDQNVYSTLRKRRDIEGCCRNLSLHYYPVNALSFLKYDLSGLS